MNTTHMPRPTRVLRTLNRVFRSQADSLDKVDSARAKQALVQQVQYARMFRM